MNKLPIEILHNIFIIIPFEQRLKCMLVCRHWYNSLSKRSLLYDLDIENEEHLNRFFNMLLLFPSRGSQVMILNLTISSLFDKRIFFNILPNLREFNFSDATPEITPENHEDEHLNHCAQPLILVHPNSKLEKIRDEAQCELTKQILKFGSCVQLKHLELKINRIKVPSREIFLYLKNAPALKTLVLHYCQFGIKDCELIHKSIPALEKLDLKIRALFPDKPPRDIIPATSVTMLTMFMERPEDTPTYLGWYEYLEEKYTNLTYFDYKDSMMGIGDSINRMKIYRNGLFPIYRNLGIPIPFVNLVSTPAESNPFNILDESDVRVTELKFNSNWFRPLFEQLLGSNQSMYIESLKVESLNITSPIILQNFPSLRSISINEDTSFQQQDIDLTAYFNAFPPTLTSFSIKVFNAGISKLPSRSNNIESLSLSCFMITPKLAKFISHCLPKLNDLKLRGMVIGNINIDLPNNYFKQVNIDAVYTVNNFIAFSVKDAKSPRPKYFIRNTDSEKVDSYISVTPKELRNRATINVKYRVASSCSFTVSHHCFR